MITILAPIGTDEVKARFEECAKRGAYHVEEWLMPSEAGGARVAATMKLNGQMHGLGFKWNGEDINDLAQRCMALDYSMQKLPALIASGKSALWDAVH